MSDTERVKPTNGDAEFRPPAAETRGGFGSGRMSSVGIPMEKSMNFGPSVRRLLRRMGPDVRYLPLVLILAFVGVTLVVLGPKVLGHATDEIVSGLLGSGIDFAALHRILLLAVGLYVTSAILVVAPGVHPRRRRAADDVPTARRRRGQAQPAPAELHRSSRAR